jgi:hypothetical protein
MESMRRFPWASRPSSSNSAETRLPSEKGAYTLRKWTKINANTSKGAIVILKNYRLYRLPKFYFRMDS